MSKEQTPIEELELRLNVMSSQEFIDWIRIEGLSKLKSSQDTKVLEALESKCIEFADLCIYKRTPREQIRSEFDKWKQK